MCESAVGHAFAREDDLSGNLPSQTKTMQHRTEVSVPAEEQASATTMPVSLPPAAVVLYRPDSAQLDGLLSGLGDAAPRVYVFVNGPVEAGVDARLTCAGALTFRSATNIGLGAALNVLIEQATADGHSHVLLLDQDSGLTPTLPSALLERFRASDTPARPLAVLAPRLAPPPGEDYLPIRYAWRDRAAGTVHFAPTSGSLLSVAAWKAVGPFRADYFIGGIDVEWGFRAWSRGFASVVAEDITLVHRWGTPAAAGTPQILRHSDERNFYYIRNAIDCLRQPYIPLAWRLRYGANLAAQIGVLLHRRRYDRRTRRLVRAALAAGLAGRLGPVESGLEIGTDAL